MRSLKVLLFASVLGILAAAPAMAGEGTGIMTSEGAGFGVASEGAGLGVTKDGGTLLLLPAEPILHAQLAIWPVKGGPAILVGNYPDTGDGDIRGDGWNVQREKSWNSLLMASTETGVILPDKMQAMPGGGTHTAPASSSETTAPPS